MIWTVPARHLAIAWLFLTLGAGCSPSSTNNLDEEKDPHFITGKNKISSYDYTGAVDAFEKALESNPQSASAHFEIGLLYYQKINDYGAAIYHFEKFLRLNPKHPRADTVKQFIITSKQELARTVSLGPMNQQFQKDLDRLMSTNTWLIAENSRLIGQVQQLQLEVAQVRSAPKPPLLPLASTLSSGSPDAPNLGAAKPASNAMALAAHEAFPLSSSKSKPEPAAPTSFKQTPAVRTHVVATGDTPAKIGRRYNVSAAKIMSANPGLDPRKMKVGSLINIPAK